MLYQKTYTKTWVSNGAISPFLFRLIIIIAINVVAMASGRIIHDGNSGTATVGVGVGVVFEVVLGEGIGLDEGKYVGVTVEFVVSLQ